LCRVTRIDRDEPTLLVHQRVRGMPAFWASRIRLSMSATVCPAGGVPGQVIGGRGGRSWCAVPPVKSLVSLPGGLGDLKGRGSDLDEVFDADVEDLA
jgi:hypothetical protein